MILRAVFQEVGEYDIPQPHVPMKIFTFNEIPTLKREDKEVIEFLRWFKETKPE